VRCRPGSQPHPMTPRWPSTTLKPGQRHCSCCRASVRRCRRCRIRCRRCCASAARTISTHHWRTGCAWCWSSARTTWHAGRHPVLPVPALGRQP
jgi:hypothetical protein